MEAFRLSRKKFANTLSGKGAAMKGARWNSPGTEIIYTASNRSLAMAEVAVHLTIATLPADYMMITIFIPNDISLVKLNPSDLPFNWNLFPPPSADQVVGDQFILDNKYCVMQIPSAVTQGDFNLLINPFHFDFKRIKIVSVEDFGFDQRLFT